LLHRFQATRALLPCPEPLFRSRIDLPLRFVVSLGRERSMRWKISHRGHDPRLIDLIAAVALVIVIIAACRFISGGAQAPSTASFIVPSQSVRW
jgi:hypothetical protein